MARKRSGKYSKRAQRYISYKIRYLKNEGIKQKQAEAIAISIARAKGLKVPKRKRKR